MSQFVLLSAYEFNDESAPEDFLPPVTFPYGAAHGSEPQYLFAFLHTPFTLPQQQLSATMQHYCTSFAKFGAPNSPTTLFWQPFSRFRCHSCECGPLSEGFERSVASPLYLVGYARWDARSDRYLLCQTIIPTAYRSQSELPVIEELSEHKA